MPKALDPSVTPYNTVALLRVKMNTGGVGWGTGAVIDANHVLTCAHNLVSRKGEYEATEIVAFPGYSSDKQPKPSEGHAATHGFFPKPFVAAKDRSWDIGVVRLGAGVKLPKYMRPYAVEGPEKVLRIAGYHGGRHYEMWEDEEVWDEINVPEHVFVYAHRTEAGSSGSPVFKSGGIQPLQYGVHSGLAENLEDKLGVLITKVTRKFVSDAVNAGVPATPFLVGLPVEG